MSAERWFDRKFDFTVPASRYPAILERLRGTPARLEERIRGLATEILTRRDAERWSVQENVGHLLDLEALWIQRAEQFRNGQAELAPADLTNRRTHEAGHNGRRITDLLAEFRREREQFVAMLEGVDGAVIERSALHPRLGTPMRLIDHALFVADHDDHHLAAIGDLISG